MKRSAFRVATAAAAIVVAVGSAMAVALAPELGAGALLHPARRRVTRSPPAACNDEMFAGAGVRLAGWRCRAAGEAKPEHSERVLAALNGPKRLVLVPGAGHNASLRAEVWPEIEHWIDRTLKRLDER